MATLEQQKPKATHQAAAVEPVKKRTIYHPRGMLELPEWAKKDKEHFYRWVSKRRLSRSDSFDPRGWVPARDPEGKSLEAHDVVLSRMPLDEHEAMMDYKGGLTRNMVQNVLEGLADTQDRLRYEVRHLGGDIKGEFSIERKSN